MSNSKEIIDALYRSMPPVFTRKKACEFLGGLFEPETLANLDRGDNSIPKHRLGRKIVYRKEDFLMWLDRFISNTNYIPPIPPSARRRKNNSYLDDDDQIGGWNGRFD